MAVVNLKQQLGTISEFWSPLEVGRVNDSALKVVRIKGEFPEHAHQHEDECFLVLDGTLSIDVEGTSHEIGAGEFLVVPRGAKHRPHCKEEVRLLLIEPASTVQQGDAGAEAVLAARATAVAPAG